MSVIQRSANGELIYTSIDRDFSKDRPDTFMDNPVIPYIIMLFCAVVDATVFINLFKMISYDNPLMLGVEVAGFLFGFDVVPIIVGIYLVRLRQGIVKDKFILWCALGAFGISFVLNVFLRIATINELAPDLSGTGVTFDGMSTQSAVQTSVSSTAIALTVFGIGLPLITSVGSFFVSYLTYNPLKIRKERLEKLVRIKKDEIRQISAIIDEYELNKDNAENLLHDDDMRYEEMQKAYFAEVLGACDYINVRIKEHLANPVSHSALSEESSEAILLRLKRELIALYQDFMPSSALVSNEITPLTPLVNKEVRS